MVSPASAAAKSRGILLVILAVALFGAVDGISKMLVGSLSFGQIMLGRSLLALLVVLAATPGKWVELYRTPVPMLQVIRGAMPFVIGGLMVFAVTYLPLAESTVILFAGPFLVVVMSGWLLREKVPASAWVGVAGGFLAVVIVARPGLDALSPFTIFPALAALFYAVLQVLTRHLGVAGETPRTTVAWTLLVSTLLALPLAVADWATPTGTEWLLLLAMGGAFGLGQHFLTKGFLLAPAGVLAPFSYFQIISAVAFDLLVFHDAPDGWTLAGIALLVVSGAYVFGRRG